MSERRGSLMPWQADCGHSMVVYSLEPTPDQCPDCSDAARRVIDRWHSDLSSAEAHASDCMNEDVAEWLAEDRISLPESTVKELQSIADLCDMAHDELEEAETRMYRLLQTMPRAERLTMPSGAA